MTQTSSHFSKTAPAELGENWNLKGFLKKLVIVKI
jgi:hypothetical protein